MKSRICRGSGHDRRSGGGIESVGWARRERSGPALKYPALVSGIAGFFTRKRTAVEERDYPRHADIVRSAVGGALRNLGWKARANQTGTIETSWKGVLGVEGSMIIRILTIKKSTRVRVESIARKGGFDFGQTASKVREFFLKLDLNLPL